jgi:hypothetical protein
VLPDDCSECRVCGTPVFGWGGICIDCEPVRDNHGRFVKQDVADRYRSLQRESLYGATQESRNAAHFKLIVFWEVPTR